MLLNIQKVSFAYHTREAHVLRDFSLSMETGDILGLLGPNGAGKTTLVSLIMGIERANSGEITLAGQPARLGRPDIALVPQEYAFYERLSGRENLEYFAGMLRLRGPEAQKAIETAVARCELQDVIAKRAGTYSGGLKRRLNFAIALLQKPKLLILDEPTAGVDPHSRSFLLRVVRELNLDGTSVIYTSHLLDEVQALCNRVAVMDAGRLLMQSSLDELLAQSQRSVTVMVDRPFDPALAENCGVTTVSGATLQLSAKNGPPLNQLAALEAAGYTITQIHYGSRRLEELFFQLTRKELRD